MQTKMMSLVEATSNTVIGFFINFTANWFILPLVFNIKITIQENLLLGILFTIISVIRGYVLRRFFNGHLKTFSSNIADLILMIKSRNST